MALARRVGPALLDGKPVALARPAALRARQPAGLRPAAQHPRLARVRVAYTAGEAIGPDLFTFYRSIGINLKQLYGSTETAVFVCLQPDGEVQAPTRSACRSTGVEIKVADSGEVLVRSPGPVQGVLQEPGGDRRGAGRRRLVPHRRRRLPRRRRAPEDHRPRQGRRPHRAAPRRRAVRAEVRREQAQVLPLHQGGGGLRRRPRPRLRVRQHRLRGGRQLGRAAQPPLRRLHRPGAEARGLRARSRDCVEKVNADLAADARARRHRRSAAS